MTYADVKKIMKKYSERGYKFQQITLTYAEYEEGEFDLNIHLWMVDRWGNKEFDCESYTDKDEKKIISKGKRLTTTLQNNGFKATWEGLENC